MSIFTTSRDGVYGVVGRDVITSAVIKFVVLVFRVVVRGWGGGGRGVYGGKGERRGW